MVWIRQDWYGSVKIGMDTSRLVWIHQVGMDPSRWYGSLVWNLFLLVIACFCLLLLVIGIAGMDLYEL